MHGRWIADGAEVAVVGINAARYEEENLSFVEGIDLPWLQDPDDGVWSAWDAQWRDLFIVDAAGAIRDVWSLTDDDLTDQAVADELYVLVNDL